MVLNRTTECVTDLDLQSEKIIFKLILFTFELSSIFAGGWGSIENWLEPKIETTLRNLACPNLLVKCSLVLETSDALV